MVNKTETLVACIRELAPRYVIGSDPFDVERLAWNIQRAEYGRPGEVAQSALAAFDVACWDLMGQALGVPVWKLLGGKFRERVPRTRTAGIRRSGSLVRSPGWRSGVVARGYRALKLDPFGAASAELAAERPRRAEAIVGGRARGRRPGRPDFRRDARPLHAGDGRARGGDARAVRSGVDRRAGAAGKRRGAGARARRQHASRLRPASARTRSPTSASSSRPASPTSCRSDLTHFGGLLPMKHLAGWADIALPAARAAQRLRSGRHDGQRALRGRDAELQGARALQRLRRPVGAGSRRPRAAGRSPRRLLCAARPAGPRSPAESRGVRRASADWRPAASCSKPAGRGGGHDESSVVSRQSSVSSHQ